MRTILHLGLPLLCAALAQPQLRTQSTEIVIPFTPVDKEDHIVTDLQREDVVLLDNGAEQPLTSMVLEDGPASIIFLLDVSGSMRKAIPHVRNAIEQLVRAGDTADEFGVIEFSNAPAVSVQFTSADAMINTRLRQLTASGRTSLIDATLMALEQIKRGAHQRKAIVIITDGQDNQSRFRERDAIRAAMETDVRIYSIELYPPIGENFFGKTLLESLAENTGGRYLPAVGAKSIPGLLARIDVHRFYRATFNPSAGSMDGKVHRIDIKLARKDQLRGGRLFWRRRYLSVAE